MRRAHVAAAVALLAATAGVPAARAQEQAPRPSFAIAILPPTKPVAGHAMTWTVRAYVTAERFSLRLARHSDDLRLLHRGSTPAWQVVDGRPQWSFAGLDPSAESRHDVRFKMAVSKHAAPGTRVCAGLRAIGANGTGATENRRATGVDRVCAKVARR
jgi:hypothetical protein